ncbi:MAG TPA: hypothetical protein PKL99_00255 [Syntrophales bacterium]|nr:hypothetical protein [Syntrophales bacterium]
MRARKALDNGKVFRLYFPESKGWTRKEKKKGGVRDREKRLCGKVDENV